MLAILGLLPTTAHGTHPSTLQAFSCQGGENAIMAMENEYIVESGYGPCWFHTGHHTYDLGGLNEVGQVTGRAFTVEMRYSPPSEFQVDTYHITSLFFEASVDGRVWSEISRVRFNLPTDRQEVTFNFDAGGIRARYLRLRQPLSLAQGLSGYLDSSSFTAALTPAHDGALTPRTGILQLSCENDIMERFHPAHPCWIGGINRYDSPSVFHTYPLDGQVTVSSILGSATFLPWRSDDYTQNGGNRQTLKAHLQVSSDGEDWSNLLTFDATYGVPAQISYEGSVETSYLRLVAEYHKGVKTHPALKHVRGMLLDSSLRVTAS